MLEYPLPRRYESRLLLKLERFNPTLSLKDRSALNMINDAEKTGQLQPGGTIIESSSGNTATSLAMIAAAKGHKFVAVIDHHCSPDKIATIEAFGGSVVKIKASSKIPAPDERKKVARQLAAETRNSFFVCQSDNPANSTGYVSLAEELKAQVPTLNVLVGAIGTGGSLCGTARALHTTTKPLHVIGVEPDGSTFYSEEGHAYYQEGAGKPEDNSLPLNFIPDEIDSSTRIRDSEAFTTCNYLASRHGLLVGGSSGAVVLAALRFVAEKPDRTAVAILADAGEKYIDTIFSIDWLNSHDLFDKAVWDYLDVVSNNQT